MLRRTLWLLAILALSLLVMGGTASAASDLEASSRASSEVLPAIERGLSFLVRHQQPDGSWEHDIGITGLALCAFLKAPSAVGGDRWEEVVDRGLEFIVGKVRDDGGIYVRDLPNYYTAVALQALVASDRDEYRDLIDRAQAFLVSLQADESVGYDVDDKFYGGIGYGADLRPDLANLEYALSP